MDNQFVPAFVNLGAVGLILWWMTSKLVPQMQRQLDQAISAFHHEMVEERALHRETSRLLMDKHEKAVDGLLEHLKTHVVAERARPA